MKYEYKGLLSERMKSGNTRWRVRVEGQRNRKIPIPMGPGEPGFDAHYRAARRGEVIEQVGPTKPTKGTFDELCENYLAWLKVQADGGVYSMSTFESRRGPPPLKWSTVMLRKTEGQDGYEETQAGRDCHEAAAG